MATREAAEYPAEYFVDSGNQGVIARAAGPLLGVFLWMRARAALRLLPQGSGRVLDYGAGRGDFVAFLRARGIDAVGYDPSPGAVETARRAGIPVFAEIPAGEYDLITFWHSLEHLDLPRAALIGARDRLKADGKLLIAVPNANSWEARFAGARWFHYDYPFHRIHFTPDAMRRLLDRAGCSVISINFFTPEYTVSGLAQTFLNFIFPKNTLYQAMAHRRSGIRPGALFALAALSLVVLVAALPLLVSFYLLQLLFRRSGAMLVVAKKSGA